MSSKIYNKIIIAFKNYVTTVGIGYIFIVYKNFYVEPWGAVHYVLNNETVVVYKNEYKTKKVQGELRLEDRLAFF